MLCSDTNISLNILHEPHRQGGLYVANSGEDVIILYDSSVEKEYRSLKSAIKVITDTVAGVDRFGFDNPDGLHSAINDKLSFIVKAP
jgi:hypothetical protein